MTEKHAHTCLVCGYDGDSAFRPSDYQICCCCGTEFGYDDRVLTHQQLRVEWIRRGCLWFDAGAPTPADWNPMQQLSAFASHGAEPTDQ